MTGLPRAPVLYIGLIAALVLGAFAYDLASAWGLGQVLFYLVPLSLTPRVDSRRAPIVVAGVCSALALVKIAVAPSGILESSMLLSRLTGIGFLWIGATAIAGRLKNEFRLRHAEEQIALAVEASGIAPWDWDLRTNIISVSPVWKRQIGDDDRDLTVRIDEWQERIHPDDRERIRADLDGYLASPEGSFRAELRYRHRDGSYRWMSSRARVIRGADGRPVRMLGCRFDITERKATEERLAQGAQRLADAQRLAGLGSYEWDLRSGTLEWSPEMFQIYGLPASTPASIDVVESLIHPEDRAIMAGAIADARARHAPASVEFRVIRPDGRVRNILGVGRPTYDESGAMVRMVGTIQDVTEARETEGRLRELTRLLLESQDEERRRIAKELHDSTAQDLAAVTMSLYDVRDDLGAAGLPVAKLDDALAVLKKSANDLRTLSYVLHPPRMDDAGLADAIRSYVRGFAERTGLDATFDLPDGPDGLSVEARLALFRVVQECLGNVLRHAQSQTVAVRLVHEAAGTVLEVRDTGIGFPPDAAAEGRAGVGIGSMRERLRHLGGRLAITTGPRGTTVRAVFPRGTSA